MNDQHRTTVLVFLVVIPTKLSILVGSSSLLSKAKFLSLSATTMRQRCLNLAEKKVLLSDLSEGIDGDTRPNCHGYGRQRVFSGFSLLLSDPFGDPPVFYRGLPEALTYRTQAFHIGACNWRCWYCFVDFAQLGGRHPKAKFFSPDQILDLMLEEEDPADIIDLTGGQPDLVPEWLLWMVRALRRRGLEGKTRIWIDDALSCDFFFQYLNPDEISEINSYKFYSRAACLKGFSPSSFSFNTGEPPHKFEMQLDLLERHWNLGTPIYVYTTFTASDINSIDTDMKRFVDRLSSISPKILEKVVPLRIHPFSQAMKRLSRDEVKVATQNQFHAYEAWTNASREFQDRQLAL